MLELIRASPGLCLSDLARALGVHPSTVDSNVHILTQANLIRKVPDGKRVRLFAAGELSPRDAFLARLGASAFVYEAVARGVPGRPVPLAHALGISRHEARSHLARLAKLGVVEARTIHVIVEQRRFVVPEHPP